MSGTKDIEEKQFTHIRSKNDVVTLLVGQGDKKEEFIVHTTKLIDNSPILQAMCIKTKKKGSQSIELPHIDPKGMDGLINAIYRDQICIVDVPSPYEYELLIKTYVTAEKFEMTRICNATMDALILLYHERSPFDDETDQSEIEQLIPFAYQHTKAGSKLRDYLTIGWLNAFEKDEMATLYPEHVADMNQYLSLEAARKSENAISGMVKSLRPKEMEEDFCDRFHLHKSHKSYPDLPPSYWQCKKPRCRYYHAGEEDLDWLSDNERQNYKQECS